MYLLKSKDVVFHVFQTYYKMMENKFGKTIKVFRSDIGGEYTSNVFITILLKMVVNRRPHVHTPKQNSVAERKNRHLVDVTGALLF